MAIAGHIQHHTRHMPVGRHVVHLDPALTMQMNLHGAHGRIDGITARRDTAHMLQRGQQAYRAVATHAQVTHVVKEDDRGQRARIDRR